MRRFLAPILLLTLLFPALAMGGEVKLDDLVTREGVYFKKFTNVPFTGKVTGKSRGKIRNGTHHVHILEMNGESYRLNQSRKRRKSPKTPE